MVPIDIFVFVLILVFGCAAFLFGLIYLVYKFMGAAVRSVFGVFRKEGSSAPRRGRRGRLRKLECPRAQCRHVEYRDARFCSQCGEPLGGR